MRKTYPDTPLTSLHRFEFILQHQSDKFLRDSLGVGFGQVRIMEEIHDVIPRSQREIAARLYQTEANISRQLKELKRHGLVKISPHKNDKRQRDVSLTAKGKKKYDQAQKLVAKQHSQLLRLLSKNELKTFEHGIHNLIAAFGGPPSSR
ncbi:winged helix-turn-helix transcriptional regulator [Candidatus Saccharibacteria bacterium]|nr:winged helix-turn-helix transcriptional regulator [Candidatus Saccharibacteria bacterium]